jgi:hypothetical protein
MKKLRLKNKFLEELERTPIVQFACDRVGISRNTYYRWMKEDTAFYFEATEALNTGIDFVNDDAESNLLNSIRRGDLSSTKYWLSSQHKRYRRPFYYRPERDGDTLEERKKKEKIAEDRLREFQRKWFKYPR